GRREAFAGKEVRGRREEFLPLAFVFLASHGESFGESEFFRIDRAIPMIRTQKDISNNLNTSMALSHG
ncbi:MAG: hypothetical protein P8Z70_12105, partial [Desulfuromonadales bacterium]